MALFVLGMPSAAQELDDDDNKRCGEGGPEDDEQNRPQNPERPQMAPKMDYAVPQGRHPAPRRKHPSWRVNHVQPHFFSLAP